MIIELLITVVLIIAGCFVLLQLYDFFENETIRTLLIAGYGLFTIFMLFHWLMEYFFFRLSSMI